MLLPGITGSNILCILTCSRLLWSRRVSLTVFWFFLAFHLCTILVFSSSSLPQCSLLTCFLQSGHRSSPSTCQSSCRKLQSSTDSSQGKAVVHHQDQCPKRWNRLWSSGTTMRNWLCSCSRWGTGRGCWVSVSIGGQGEWMPSDLFLQNALFCE